MSRPRDSQRSKLYAAETKAYVATYGQPQAHDDGQLTWPETVAYIRAIERTRWWRSRYNRPFVRGPVTIKPGKRGPRGGGAWAQRSTGTVNLAPWARRPHVILHELAHLLTPDHYAAHGPEFAKAFIALARRFEPDLAPNLVAEFRAARIRTRAAS